MLRLRKILLCDYLYYSILLYSLLYTIINISNPPKTSYTEKSKTFAGIVTKIVKKEYTTIYIKNKEIVSTNLYHNKNNIELGDKVKITGKFQKKTSIIKDNPIYFYTIKISSIKILKKNKNIYYHFKQLIINNLENSPYLNTFILGDKSYIKEDVNRSFRENGISHLFAISGMHITLLANLIRKLLKKLSEETVFKITSSILIIYLLLVGFSPSILRGVLFYILFSINRIYYFYIKKTNLFFLTLSVALFINPFSIYNIGLLYSYSISISLLILSNELSGKYIISLLKVSLVSTLISLPISLYYFNQINILSIIYNLIFVPFISIILFPFSLIVFIIKPLIPIYNILIQLLENISLLLSNVSIGKLVFKKMNILLYIVYYIYIFIIFYKKEKLLVVLLIFILSIHYFIPYFDSNTFIEMIDVNQGDSTLMKINNKIILIDTGGENDAFNKDNHTIFYNNLSPKLKELGIHKLNYLIISHGDYDHMGEAINLVNNFKVEKVIFNCGPFNDLEKELIKVLDKKKIKYYSCIKELNIDSNKLYFLQTKEYDNENDNSNVIYTELNGYKFMFMGDASTTTEHEILNDYNLPDIDVLKVGHHGSKTSSSIEFINEINPKYSIISVGKKNRYGHPNKEVLDNLEKSRIYRTDQDGSIMLKIRNNNLKIETCTP